MRSQKETSWRKSRKFGDVFGGRTTPKLTDGIFQRLHPLAAPAEGQKTPIVIEDNPSRDFFFPIDGQEVSHALRQLPSSDVAGITHVWLRRVKKNDFESYRTPNIMPDMHFQDSRAYICGHAALKYIVPWPRPSE